MKKMKQPAAPVTAQPPEQKNEKVSFEELIQGEYAEDFRKKAEEIRAEGRQEQETDYAKLLHTAEAAKRAYPDFDLRRELGNPQFAAMVLRGVDAKRAYEAVHHEDLLRRAMAYGVQRTAERLAAAKMAARPAENGADGQSASVSRMDPRSLTRAEREELRRRVIEKKERVTF